MARKGQRRGLKRSKAPKLWKLARKEKKWTINPHPGPHTKEAIPLAFIIRDQLGYAHTLREAKQILNERKVKVNGNVRTDFKFPVGIMDVVEIPITGDSYRVLPDRKGTLELHPVRGEEKHFRPLKITGKTLVKAGKTQLQFHDGTTLILKEGSKGQDKSGYSTCGTVLYDFESRTITDYFPFTKGSFAMITGGRNVSRTGKIASVKDNMVEIEGDETFRTLKENVFVIGTKESIISLAGG
jgi:small subunit ribosomal protein S4e